MLLLSLAETEFLPFTERSDDMKDNKCSRCEKPKDQWEVPTYLISGSATNQPKAEKVCRACLDEFRKR